MVAGSHEEGHRVTSALITGAAGFIGGRLAEHLVLEGGVRCAGLVRTWSRAARLARLPVELIGGDLMDYEALLRAARGRDTIFHCAVEGRIGGRAQRRAIVRGTENVLRAALASGARLVHLSTVAVYGYAPRADAATEAGAYRSVGDGYADGKIDAERLVFRYHRAHGLPVVVLRPTIVYGPYGPWSLGTVRRIRSGGAVLVDGGRHRCNALYIDNLVQALRLAAESGAAVGQAFHVADAEAIDWKTFLEGHARALGAQFLPLPDMTADDIEAARREQRSPSAMRMLAGLLQRPEVRTALAEVPPLRKAWAAVKPWRALLAGRWHSPLLQTRREPGSARPDASLLPSAREVEVYRTRVTFSIDKARRMLGYRPTVDFAEGMAKTAAWLRWSGV